MRLFPTLAAWTALWVAVAGSPAAYADYGGHPRALQLLQVLRDEYGFGDADLVTVRGALTQAERVPKLIEAEQQAKERTLTWNAYRVIHLREVNFKNGLRFLTENRQWLAKAETEYGVPPAVIAAVLGVETKYGTQSGNHRVLDSLATQGFDHPTRAAFFLRQLAEYFALCRENGFDAAAVKGSYAGAMGAAQFMPSNYRRLAVDFDGDGAKDLWKLPDAIGSVANYLANFAPATGWRRGEPLMVPLSGGDPADDMARNTKTQSYTVAQLLHNGFKPLVGLPPTMPAGLIELTRDDGKEYWLGLHNFYAVMSYNPRVYYAMAVAQLAEALQQLESPAR